MNEEQRWEHLLALDEELLLGGAMVSEWCAFVVREADTAFAKGANLASVLTAVSGIETHLRAEQGNASSRLVDLIDQASLPYDLRRDVHRLRRYRNKWVHVDPSDDQEVLNNPGRFEAELEEMAFFAARVLRRVIYTDQWL